MKLLGISLGTLLVAAMIWATLWFWGKSLTYKSYEHPLTTWVTPSNQPVLALSTENYQEAQAFLHKHPDGILMLNLRVSRDGHFFTAQTGALDFVSKLPQTNVEKYEGNKHYYYDYAFLKESSSDLISANQWITLKPRFWILNFLDNALDMDKHIIQWVEAKKLQESSIIASDTDLILSSVKQERPLWVFGSSLSDLTKILTLASVNLESLVNFKRDYFMTPVTLKKRTVLNPKAIVELKRRFKKVAIGPVHTDQDRALALEQNPDILILGSLELDK